MPPTPRSRDFFNIFVKFFSIFRVFVNAVRVQNFFGTSGSSRSVCCQSFSSVRRLEATKTPKNRNEKKCKLWTGVYPPRIAPFGLKLWENAFQTIPDISFFDATKLFFDKNFRQKKIATPKISKISKVPVLEELWIFGRHWQIRLENSLPELSVSAFYDPWRRGKKGSFCFFRKYWQKKTCTFFALKLYVDVR